jgi:hypothetical protein
MIVKIPFYFCIIRQEIFQIASVSTQRCIVGYTFDIIESVTYSFCWLLGRINFNAKDIEDMLHRPRLTHTQQPAIFFFTGFNHISWICEKVRSPTSFTETYITDGTNVRPKINHFSATLRCLYDSRSQPPIFFHGD